MSLSRRYRPQKFSDITGQDSVKETLRREIETGKIGHAYLFFGPRGVGKTTTARIFAKALNCLRPERGEPCNACDRCAEANSGSAIDVIEMDAASNTGVEHVREAIVEHVRFTPGVAKFKVYILDEAHMLSTSAWNAMLKTLEEPPEHGIFILATTEFHKVPVTIVSRCQRFEFTRVGRDDIQERVRQLAAAEGAELDEDVIVRIAKHAEGSVRDAETLLGQIIALGEKKVTGDVAGLLLPVSNLPKAAEFLRTLSQRSLKETMAFIAKLDEQGVVVIPFFHDVIEAVRHLLIASDDEEYRAQLREGEEGERALSELVGVFPPAELRDIALLCMEHRKEAKQGIDPRFALELAGAAVSLAVLPNSPKGITKPSNPPQSPTAAPTKKEIPAPAVAPKKQTGDLSLSRFQSVWPEFLKKVNESNPSLSFILKTSQPEDVSGNTACIRVSYVFHRTKLIENLAIKQKLEVILRELLGDDVLLDAVVNAKTDSPPPKNAKTDTVSALLNNFGGSVVE